MVTAPSLDATTLVNLNRPNSEPPTGMSASWLVPLCVMVNSRSSVRLPARSPAIRSVMPGRLTKLGKQPGHRTGRSIPTILPQADRYVGRVFGPDGHPLAGARLYLIDAKPIPERPSPRCAP